MSFDKEYPNRKDWRKPYRTNGKKRAKSVSRKCCNNGTCSYCRDNRLIRALKEKSRIESFVRDFYEKHGYAMSELAKND